MNADGGTPDALSPRDGLAEQLRQLQEFVARTESAGEELPPEAVEMISRLKEIMQALDGLASSMGEMATGFPTNAGDAPSTGPS